MCLKKQIFLIRYHYKIQFGIIVNNYINQYKYEIRTLHWFKYFYNFIISKLSKFSYINTYFYFLIHINRCPIARL